MIIQIRRKMPSIPEHPNANVMTTTKSMGSVERYVAIPGFFQAEKTHSNRGISNP